MAMVNGKTSTDGRKQYTAIDMLKQAAGLPTPEGWAVLTKEFANDLQDELERLYGIEEEALAFIQAPNPSPDGLKKALNLQ